MDKILDPSSLPGAILHITNRTDWECAVEEGVYSISSRGLTLDQVGFIHASLPEQISEVAEFIYADDPEELVVLVLDPVEIQNSGTEIRLEDGGDGELFPHIYGPIDPSWVVGVEPAGFTGKSFWWGTDAK